MWSFDKGEVINVAAGAREGNTFLTREPIRAIYCARRHFNSNWIFFGGFGFISGYGVLPKLYFPNFKITRQQRFLSFQQEPFLDLDVLFGKLKDIKPRQQSVEWWSLHSPNIWQRRPPRNIGRPIPIFCWSTLTPDHICPTNCDKSHTYFHYSVPFWHQIKFVAKDKSYNISQKHVYMCEYLSMR